MVSASIAQINSCLNSLVPRFTLFVRIRQYFAPISFNIRFDCKNSNYNHYYEKASLKPIEFNFLSADFVVRFTEKK